MGAYSRNTLRKVFTKILGKPVAWRYRSKDEPKWEYSEKKLIAKDLFRKEPGFEEQSLYADIVDASPAISSTDSNTP